MWENYESEKRSIALLRSCLYPKPLVPVPKPIDYGRKMEPIAIRRYISEMKSVIGKTVSVNKCGFIYPSKCWLGATADGHVVEDSCEDQNCILEVKCPFSKQNCSIEEACQDCSFFREMVDSTMQLKTTHLSPSTASTNICWSRFIQVVRFCVYTHKGVAIQCILPDIKCGIAGENQPTGAKFPMDIIDF